MMATHLELIHAVVLAVVHLLLHRAEVHHLVFPTDDVQVVGVMLCLDRLEEESILPVS